MQAEEAAAKLSELANELRVLDVEVETVTFKVSGGCEWIIVCSASAFLLTTADCYSPRASSTSSASSVC